MLKPLSRTWDVSLDFTCWLFGLNYSNIGNGEIGLHIHLGPLRFDYYPRGSFLWKCEHDEPLNLGDSWTVAVDNPDDLIKPTYKWDGTGELRRL